MLPGTNVVVPCGAKHPPHTQHAWPFPGAAGEDVGRKHALRGGFLTSAQQVRPSSELPAVLLQLGAREEKQQTSAMPDEPTWQKL